MYLVVVYVVYPGPYVSTCALHFTHLKCAHTIVLIIFFSRARTIQKQVYRLGSELRLGMRRRWTAVPIVRNVPRKHRNNFFPMFFLLTLFFIRRKSLPRTHFCLTNFGWFFLLFLSRNQLLTQKHIDILQILDKSFPNKISLLDLCDS